MKTKKCTKCLKIQPELVIIDSPQGIRDLQEYIKDFEYLTYDTETTGLLKTSEIIGFSICAEETKAFYVILAKWDKNAGKMEYLPGNKEASFGLISCLREHQLICHNGVFDCYITEAFFKINLIDSLHTDTMVLAHLLDENRRVGLKELGKLFFGEEAADQAKKMKESVIANGGQLTKSNYEMYKADAYLMAEYGAQDALLTLKLFLTLVPDLYEQGLEKFFYEEESMPLLKGPTYQLNNTGLQVDTKALLTLKKTLEAECIEAKAFVYQEIDAHIKEKYPGTNKKKGFNIGSNQQLSWLLFGKLGLEFATLTKAGKEICKELGLKLPYTASAKRDFIARCNNALGDVYQPEAIVNGKKVRAKKYSEPWKYIAVDKAVLKKLAPKYQWIERLLEYQRKTKLLNTYVEGIESRLQYGILQPSFKQTGTTSGRYSSQNPNFQNLPRDDQRVKDCIIARPGKMFVSADFSQLEPRIFSYYSQDPRLLAAFDGTSDFYSVVGIGVYEIFDALPQKEGSPEAFGIKYKKLRDLSKVIALASAYGATPFQLAPTTGKSVQDTEEDMDNYFEKFPGVKKMMLEAHELAKKDGFVTSLFGRKRRIPDAVRIDKIYGKRAHAELPYDARSMLNLAVNHRIQSTGASICNRAMIAFNNMAKEAGIECRIVSQVHDEIIVEGNEQDAENISLLLQHCMENTTTLEGVSLEALPRITKTLAK